jgi:thiamine pyrophosphate-dependent acetolactate synthase large subunit-like protein
MYQLEVKRWLVSHKFPAEAGWDVTVDIDSMERGKDGQQRADKQSIAAECENWLRSHKVKIQADSVYGRAYMVARKESVGTVVVEVEGDSSRQKEQAMYSALGQIVLSMGDPSREITYALAVPDDEKWAAQLRKVPNRIRALLNLQLWLVSESGVRSAEN